MLEKRQSLQQMVLGKLDTHVSCKRLTRSLCLTLYKNKFKMDQRF
jgi:hypothetical protein